MQILVQTGEPPMATIVRRGNRFRVQVRHKDRSLSRTFGSRAEARRWALEAEAGGQEPSHSLTLREALDRYLREVSPTKRGYKAEADRIRAWMSDPLASRPLASIRTADLAQWKDRRRGLAPSTIRNALTIISQVFKVAAGEWGLEGLHNPVAAVRLPKANPPRERRLEPGEEERLLEATSHWPHLHAAFVWALETAMRRGEMLALQRREVVGRVARLQVTKNGRARAVPLSTRALAVLASRPEVGFLFPLSPAELQWQWGAACRRAGVVGLRWHDLRHEAVSRLFERGLTAEEVMLLSGHRTYAMLARYTHLRAEGLLAKLG